MSRLLRQTAAVAFATLLAAAGRGSASGLAVPPPGTELSMQAAVTGVLPGTHGMEFTVASPGDPNGAGVYVSGHGGYFEDARGGPGAVAPGSIVELRGVAEKGEFAPIIHAYHVKILSQTALPAAPVRRLGDFAGGGLDSTRARLSGVAVGETMADGKRVLAVQCGDGVFKATLDSSAIASASLVDAEVSLSGVALSLFNIRREFTGINLAVSRAEDVSIDVPPPSDPFEAEECALDSIAAGTGGATRLHRRKVRGTATLSRPGFFYLQDAGGNALRVDTDMAPPEEGARVEAAGFVSRGAALDKLSGAVWRKAPGEARIDPRKLASLPAYRTPGGETAPDGALVSIDARLRGVKTPSSGPSVATLEFDGGFIDAEFPAGPGPAGSMPDGAAVTATGVYTLLRRDDSVDFAEWEKPAPAALLLRSAADISPRKDENLFDPVTMRRVRRVAAAAAALLVFALARSNISRRRAITALKRKAAEEKASLEAVLEERLSVSSVIHDTVQQDLAAAALEFDIALKSSGEAAAKAMNEGRRMLAKARMGVRDIVWDLRSRTKEKRGGTP